MESAFVATIVWFFSLVAILTLPRHISLPPWLPLTGRILFGVWTAACLFMWFIVWQERREWKKNKLSEKEEKEIEKILKEAEEDENHF
ncbi:MAG: hypothetical protein HYY44_05745 [Deltaproteobacteria bacterium]|nr:hypothetical protein [Deltaproteobacteria bacterium]MBI4374693.1 hypothetical protein [Deltaproteobacteria bacterium]